MTTQTEVDIQLQEIIEPVEHQGLIDALSALGLLGKISVYEAKDCIECGDWELAETLVEEAR